MGGLFAGERPVTDADGAPLERYRFYFFSNEGFEPPHIHVDRAENSVKFWLEPVAVARNFGFSQRDVRTLQAKVEKERERFVEAWHGYFDNRR